MSRYVNEYNKLDYCPGCNKDLKGKSNRSKSAHRMLCKDFYVLLGKDVSKLQNLILDRSNSHRLNGRCHLLSRNRPKDQFGRDVYANERVKDGSHNLLINNRLRDEKGKDVLASTIKESVRKNHTNPWLHKNLKLDESGNYIIARKIVESRFKNGWIPPHRFKHYWYKGIHMRSPYEVEFAQWLDANSIEWQYEPRYFRYEYRGSHKYLPDFFISSFGYVEVKADYFAKKDLNTMLIKLDAVRKSGFPICLLTEINWFSILNLLLIHFDRRILAS